MKKIVAAMVACCMLVAVVALAGCNSNTKEKYIGTWDLQYSEVIDEAAALPGQAYTAEEITGFHESGMELYMNLTDNGVAIIDIMGSLTTGKWEISGNGAKATFQETTITDPDTGEVSDTNEAELSFDKDTLKMVKDNTTFYFAKGEDKDPYEMDDGMELVDDEGLSILIAEQGSKLSSPVTVADDDTVKIVFDGVGVDTIGDPGYNVQLENKSADMINIWLPDTVKVGEKDVHAYLYITLNPGQKTVTFLQLDTEEIESKSTEALVDVKGTFQVDNASSGETINTYDFEM